jgi:endoglucanase
MLLLALLSLATVAPSPAADTPIRLNTVGFLPEAPKVATVAAPCSEFAVVRASDGKVVYTHQAGDPVRTSKTDTDETVQTLDFSALTAPGTYRVVVKSVGESAPFTVARGVWNQPYEVVTRAMYLWRCGTAVQTTWNGQTFAHGACHLDDAWLDYVGGGHQQRKSTGGWHDAGDYNKYPVNAGVTVGFMLKAWEQFGDRIGAIKTGIPESTNKIPDLLDEVRWEAEWLLTMQDADGKVYHKVSELKFSYWGAPDKDVSPRYFAPWSTAATADLAAMLAETARAWRPYDAVFADRCLAAAEKSWKCLLAHPTPVSADLTAFKTGGYPAKDESHRLWAAVELWETTGDVAYLREFERRAATFSFSAIGPTWPDVHDLAFGTYLLSSRTSERSPELVARLTKDLVAKARAVVETDKGSAYGRPLGGEAKTWNWGCNGIVAGQTYLLHLADRIAPDPAYRTTAQDALGFLFGRNFHGRSYVSGLGARPPEHMHDRRGAGWPGYLVGGAWPTGRDWEDVEANFRVNEIAINWNGALIYALAAFVEPDAK